MTRLWQAGAPVRRSASIDEDYAIRLRDSGGASSAADAHVGPRNAHATVVRAIVWLEDTHNGVRGVACGASRVAEQIGLEDSIRRPHLPTRTSRGEMSDWRFNAERVQFVLLRIELLQTGRLNAKS